MLVFFLAMTAYCGTIEIWEGYVGARYWPMFLLVIADLLFLAKTIGVYKSLPKEAKKVDLSVFKSPRTITCISSLTPSLTRSSHTARRKA